MTNEEKQRLLNDLCGRLPHGVKVFVSGDDFDNYQYPYLLTAISKFGQDILCKVYSPIYIPLGCPSIENVKPYLRPMSSMTEEEKEEFESLVFTYDFGNGLFPIEHVIMYWDSFEEVLDWLNEHHFDYRNLIEKGLALEASEGMYKTE